MKHYIKDIDSQKSKSPCTNCGVGSGSYSRGIDKNGEFVEITSCRDTCTKYKKYKGDICNDIKWVTKWDI